METNFSVQKCQVRAFNFSQCPWPLTTHRRGKWVWWQILFVYWFVSCCWISSSNWFSFEVFSFCFFFGSVYKFRSYHSLNIVEDYALNMFFLNFLSEYPVKPLNIHLQKPSIDLKNINIRIHQLRQYIDYLLIKKTIIEL